MANAITDIPGLKVGHYTDAERGTGCTVILCETGAVAGVDVRGGAPGTRETELLRPGNLVDIAHAILLTGGSAFGLGAAQGVMRYLAERQVGYGAAGTPPALRVPIVPAAVIYDLAYKQAVWPSPDDAYAACLAASDVDCPVGSVGAGSGATVGKLLGPTRAAKGGIGTASIHLSDGTIVAALIVVNAFGDIRDRAGRIIAGATSDDGTVVDTVAALATMPLLRPAINQLTAASLSEPPTSSQPAQLNTTIGVVATNAPLNNAAATAIARMAHDGLSRVIHPCHTLLDGDTIFALGLGRGDLGPMAVSQLGALAAEAATRAILSIWQAYLSNSCTVNTYRARAKLVHPGS